MDNVTLIRIISGVLATSVFLLPLYVLPTILAWKKTHRMPIPFAEPVPRMDSARLDRSVSMGIK
jgi:hypothetical protein